MEHTTIKLVTNNHNEIGRTMDYRKLCVESFSTVDKAPLRKAALEYGKKNTRNAGRKRKITDGDIQRIKTMRNAGMTIQELSKIYRVSRQTIGRYLSTPASDGYTMRITYMFRRQPCTVIDVNFLDQRVVIQNKTDDILHRAFGVLEHPTWNDFELFLQGRCFPRTRGDCKELLQEMGLTDYDPLQIVEITKGRLSDDEMWLKFRYLPKEKTVRADH